MSVTLFVGLLLLSIPAILCVAICGSIIQWSVSDAARRNPLASYTGFAWLLLINTILGAVLTGMAVG